MGDVNAPSFDPDCKQTTFFGKLFYCANNSASTGPTSFNALGAAIAVSAALLGGQTLIFILLRFRLTRIYRPKSYLVPERERVPAPPGGIVGWLYPLWSTSNHTLIQKCGLDAYFFLRYLRVQLKIFFPAAIVILPILLPVNKTGGGGAIGLSQYSLSNVASSKAGRFWTHLILAVVFICWVFYVVYQEFRAYIRIRQAYLTSPEHRIRASATTVLVTGIPLKWLSLEALSGLYDVYPGGIRNIWINRHYEELAEKVKTRDEVAKSLEGAETNLIKMCRKNHDENEKKRAKDGGKSKTREEEQRERDERDAAAERLAEGQGLSTGAHEETRHGTEDILHQPQGKAPAVDGPSDSTHHARRFWPGKVFGGHAQPMSHFGIEEPQSQSQSQSQEASLLKPWLVFKNNDQSLSFPSPQPHHENDDEYPLHSSSETPEKKQAEYPEAIDEKWDEDQDGDARWLQYLKPEERETMRLPVFNPSWLFAISIPFFGKKVDRIYHLRRELARLNLEIEADQADVKKYPLMNSAFIQFSNQIAAHMCCQSLSHHVPRQMAPRTVEISPDDVIWDNMSITWWGRYLRTVIVLVVSAGLVVFWAIPVAFTGLLGNISALVQAVPWLSGLQNSGTGYSIARAIIQGVLPPLLLVIILALVPIIFRALIQLQGVATGNAKEQGVQIWYFAFLFIQVFFVVTISTGLGTFAQNFSTNITDPLNIFTSLADSLPPAANYFFSYLTVQAMSNSASNLLQTGGLVTWFLLAPVMDSTAREKWRRQTQLNRVQWGSFFPPFTNFATIGVIYSILSPLILVFMLLIYGLFSIVYRYNILFVYQFRNDTGGLLFPVALNQMFTGLYFLEICLIGLFFAVSEDGDLQCVPQGAIMVVALVFTALLQWQLNETFEPLFQYLPITLEDEAVIRDEAFAKAQASKFAPLMQQEDAEDTGDSRDAQEDVETTKKTAQDLNQPSAAAPSERWKPKPVWKPEVLKKVAPEAVARLRYLADGTPVNDPKASGDVEQQQTVGDVLYAGFADELEDLTPQERDSLVRYAFQHPALRARRPVIWIPRDALGVSDDEILRAKKMSTVLVNGEEKTHIWMSNEGTALDGKGRVVFRKSPPDFRSVDLIAL